MSRTPCTAVSESAARALHDVAALLFPADPARSGVVVDATDSWLRARHLGTGSDVVVWCRPPDRRTPLAVGRDRARVMASCTALRLIPPHPYRVVRYHPVPPRQFGAVGIRNQVRARLREGALVELSALPAQPRVLDEVARDAGVTGGIRRFHVAGGGSILMRVEAPDTRAVLRVAIRHRGGPLAGLADTLMLLQRSGLAVAPALLGHGATRQACWLLEGLLPGQQPTRLRPSIVADTADALSRFPRNGGSATAVLDDLLRAADLLEARAPMLRRLALEIGAIAADLPGILRHGDLWAGNLLVSGGRLTGIVDWDAAHPAGVPGADLLHLIADDRRRSLGRSVGWLFRQQPWRALELGGAAVRRYWREVGVGATVDHLELTGIAWWAAVVAGTVERFPERALDEPWLEDNVDRVLEVLKP